MVDVKRWLKATLTHGGILDLMAGIVLVVAIILAFTKNGTDQATTALFVIFLAYLLFLRQGRLATVKFNKEGFEATMAEVREATQGAEKATKEVKELMKTTSVAVLGLIKRSGRLGGYSYDAKEQIRQDILSNIGEMGISPEGIEDIERKSQWHEYTAWDYVHYILTGFHMPVDHGPRYEEAEKLQNRPVSNVATPDELEEFCTKHSLLTKEVRDLIEDYRYYLEHHKLRRSEVWAKRDEWYKLIGRTDTSPHTENTRNGNAS